MGKILIVSCVFPPEPVVSAMLSYDIAKSLYDMGKEVVVLSPEPTRPLNYKFDNNTSLYPFEHVVLKSFTCPESNLLGRTRESFSFGKAVAKYIHHYSTIIDCIYANTWPLFSQWLLIRAAKAHDLPCIIHEQDIYPESYCSKMPPIIGKLLYRLLIPIDKYVQRNATYLLGISPSMIDYLSESRCVEKSKYVLVRNWQDDQRFIDTYRPLEKNRNGLHLMYLGSINPTANVSLIIKAAAKVSKIQLSIVGNGPDKEKCQATANDLCVDAQFETVVPEKVAIKQREADVLILCLKKGVALTATPSKLTAYMLSGRPVIASVDLKSDCANIIRESGCGIVVEPDDVDKLSKAISEMASKSEKQLNEMGASAFEYAMSFLSKEKNLKRITEIIDTETRSV